MAASTSKSWRRKLFATTVACALAIGRLNALTMSELLNDPKMTPKRFASLFADFEFDAHPFDVQNPNQFLATRSGDCIDYAVLADFVLKKRGYATRLIRVEMVGKNTGHAVCYVTESRAYLDYNNRRYFFTLEHSGPSIREIATNVADSFDANWTFAQEFTYDYDTDLKRAVFTIVKTDPPTNDPDRARTNAPGAKPKA
jgi:hypothetical protein